MFLPVCFVLDDGTVALDVQRDKDAPGGVSVLSESMFMGRALGIQVVYAVHTFKSISETVRRNTCNILVLGAQGEDLNMLACGMGLNAEQENKLRLLKPGECVAYAPDTWDQAVFGTFPAIPTSLDDALMFSQKEAFLLQVVAEVGGQAPPATPTIDPVALRLAIAAADLPYRIITEHYRHLRLTREEGRKAVEWLQSQGFAQREQISSGKQGGQLALLLLTPKGEQELINRGLPRPVVVTRGGFLHNAVALALQELGRKQQHAVYFERMFEGGVYADVVFEGRRGGELVAVQVGLSSIQWETKSIQRLLCNPGITLVVLVCRDKKFLDKTAHLLGNALSAEERARVRLRTVGEVILEAQ